MKSDLTPNERVSRCLRRCALVIDPLRGHLKTLAAELDVHETTLSLWIREGRVPDKAARRLLKQFGPDIVDLDNA